MFVLKKIIGHLLMPLPLGLGLLTLGLLLIVFRRRVRGWLLLLLGWLVLAVAANRAVSLALTASLEKAYPPVPALAVAPAQEPATSALPALPEVEPADSVSADTSPDAVAAPIAIPEALRGVAFVAILGGGHGDAPGLPAGQRLSPSARARLIEGVRIALALPDAWLVVCGPRNDPYNPAPSDRTQARALADTAVELGFPRDRIVETDTGRDTAEEIDAIRLLVGDERVALVTSAWHLPRAMKLASTAKLDAFPCPADYLGGRDARIGKLAYVTWDADSLQNTTRAWREYVGRAWTSVIDWWRD